MIELVDVTRRFERERGISNVSFRLEKGEWILLVGAAGAGKSTILRLIYADDQPDSGEIIVDNTRVRNIRRSQLTKLRRKMGVVDQDLSLIFDRTVYKNVALVGEILGWSRRKTRTRSLKVLHQVGLYAHLDSFPGTLSYGERRRLAIARALVAEPLVLIADEPLGNLDPDSAHGVAELFHQIHMQGTALLLATHRREYFEEYQPKVLNIEKGKVKAK